MQKYLLIAIGGALGSIARVWVSSAVTNRMGFKFPYGTLIVNITACLIIGLSITYLGKRADLNPAWRYLIPMGFIGAYSTFSTYEWETLVTLRSGDFSWPRSTPAAASWWVLRRPGAERRWPICCEKRAGVRVRPETEMVKKQLKNKRRQRPC